MTAIYFTNIISQPDDVLFNKLLDSADAGMKEKVLQYKFRPEQVARLYGRRLLYKLLCSYEFEGRFCIKDMKYNDWGKPYFSNPYNDFDFSISHSGNMVVCAATDHHGKIGVDIEKNEFRNFDTMQEYFTDKEWSSIKIAEDTDEALYKMWVRKEACIKAIGKGLFLPLHEIDVSEDEVSLDGTVLRLYNLYHMKGYTACMATSAYDTVTIVEVGINKLIDQINSYDA